ncbi:MAG: alpha/beta hydrolase, partial [Dolichospermum sp.]
MFPSFLPPAVGQLTQTTSIDLAQNIQRQAITVPYINANINTTYVYQGHGGTPILLINGFDSSVLEYRQILPLLAENNQFCAVELLGFG